MVAVDTNILVRLLVHDDVNQTRSAERFVQNGCWVSILALAETMWVLKYIYDFSQPQIIWALEMLLNNQQLAIENSEAVTDALQLLRGKPALGFADCLMLELARKVGHLPLGTFDRHLSKLPGTIRL